MDEAALFLSDKNNAVSVNLVRGKWTLEREKNVFLLSLHAALLMFALYHRLCSSHGHGNPGAKDNSCQTWTGWKIGKLLI